MAKVLFCDIETSGLDPEDHQILECYCRVFDLDTLQSGAEFYWLAYEVPVKRTLNSYVLEMHQKNGLFSAIANNHTYDSLSSTLDEFLVEEMKEEYVASKIVLAGRSVHFDLSFLHKIHNCWHHRVFDLRSIIEFWTANTNMKDIEERFSTTAELAEHRAKQDVLNDILLYQDIAYQLRSAAGTKIT